MIYSIYNNIKMDSSKYRRTGNECPTEDCEGELLQAEHERFCNECYTVMDEATFPNNNRSLYARWHEHRRSEYSGFYGSDRVKMIGGFSRPYFVGEEKVEEDSILL